MKALHKLHKWIGLLTGLLLIVLCLTGAVIVACKVLGVHSPVVGWMVGLHRSLFLGHAGHVIVTVATGLCVVEVITGYCLWVKIAHRAGVRQALRWTFPNKLLGIHNGAGLWAGVPLLVMALTGLTLSFMELHVGSFWGMASRALWLIAAILGASLPITGFLIFWRKR